MGGRHLTNTVRFSRVASAGGAMTAMVLRYCTLVLIPLGMSFGTSCGLLQRQPSIPSYAEKMPESEEETRLIYRGIIDELGYSFRVEQVEKYCFVASNDSAQSFRTCKRTISQVYQYLYRDFFTQKPEKPIRVYLFKDKATYNSYCEATYSNPPSTPFGFYMRSERKTVMNIATGTGTLASQLVYPLLSRDVPNVPTWFSTGFSSLFEQSGWREGRMVGFVNWRLPKFQKSLKGGQKVPLRELMGNSLRELNYGEHQGYKFAAARYLCYYLQELGLLRSFYRDLKSAANDDPLGISTLEKVTGKKLEALEKEWEQWVLDLEYGTPPSPDPQSNAGMILALVYSAEARERGASAVYSIKEERAREVGLALLQKASDHYVLGHFNFPGSPPSTGFGYCMDASLTKLGSVAYLWVEPVQGGQKVTVRFIDQPSGPIPLKVNQSSFHKLFAEALKKKE